MPRERAVRQNVPVPLRFPSTNGLPVATLRYVHRAHSPSPINCKSKAAPQLSSCSPAFLPQGSTKHRHHTAHWSSVPDSVRLPDRPSSSVYRLCRKRPASPPLCLKVRRYRFLPVRFVDRSLFRRGGSLHTGFRRSLCRQDSYAR